jgi:MFS family permease
MPSSGRPVTRWWQGVTGYQWLVFTVASVAWLFDNLDQRLFSLSRIPALADLMPGAPQLAVQANAKVVTALFLIGWGIGGLVFGTLGDRCGRSRVLNITVVIYALGTGLTALCQDVGQFAVLRFVTGIGIGGVFGLAVAIIADTVSGAARVAMLALLQVLSTVGNIAAAFVKMGVDQLAEQGTIQADGNWRWLYALGAVPLGLAIVGALWIREPEAWRRVRDSGTVPNGWLGPYRLLFSRPEDRRNLVIGTLLAVSGVVGLWAIGEFAVDLQHAIFTAHFAARVPADEVAGQVASAKNWAYLLQMAGGAMGMFAFAYAADRFGRRPAFAGGFACAFVVTLVVYGFLETPQDAYWMMPLMGAAQLSVFAGFSIYLPELFSGAVRGTGVSFAYSLGRFAAAAGSFASALLTTRVFGGFAAPLPLRYAAMTMCGVFLVGIVAALLAPETRGKELRA